ncbi:MAG: ATP-binding protein [Dehalococcoidia bacterium]|nr:ATP-binding protein [Dehalococcoidia bacterium]MDW8119163.1 ATP-binding protein [Chloroflexota bacterium]
MWLRSILYLTPPAVTLALNVTLLLMVLRAPRKTGLYYLFALFLGAMAFWSLFIFAVRASPSNESALLWQRVAFAFFPIIGVSWLHFVLLLTRRITRVAQVWPLYGLLAVLSALGPSPWVVQGVVFHTSGWGPVGGPLFVPWMVAHQLVVVAGMAVLLSAYQQTEAVDERNRYLYLCVGAVVALAGIATDYLTAVGVMTIPLGMVGYFLFSIATAIAVMRTRLLDLQVAAQRGAVYLLTSAAVAGLYLLVLLAVSRWLARQVGLSFAIQILLLFVLALAFQPLQRYLQEVADRWLYGRRYDYLRLLRTFAATSQSIVDLPHLVESLTRIIRIALRAQGVWLLFPTPKGDFAPVQGEGPSLSATSPVVRWLAHEGRILWRRHIDTLPALHTTPPEERRKLQEWDVRILIPLRTPSGLTGVLALGPRQGRERYSQAELDMLFTVAQQVAISLENARLFALEREQVKRLQELDKMKTDFLGMISHQLKTPVTSVKAALGLLKETEPTPTSPARSRLLNNVERSVRTLEQLINDLLEFAKVRSGQLALERSPTVLQEVVQEAVHIITPSLEAKRQRLVVDMPPEPMVGIVDSRRLVQVLVNLLSNAHKYSPAGSTITLRLGREQDDAVVSVSDSCGGIPAEDLPYLFEAYRHPRSAPSETSTSGTGLGLSIAKGMVELHGGRIWVVNHPGRGCTFSFAVPLSVSAEVPSEKDTGTQAEGSHSPRPR